MTNARLVGIDFGMERVGLAVADPLRIFATPVGVFSRKEAILKLVEMHKSPGLEMIVLGWPIGLDGSEGETVTLVRKFERQIKGALPHVPITRLDERFTSIIAKRVIHAAGGKKSSRERKGRVDEVAAAVLLQSFLDSRVDPEKSV